MLLLSGYKKYGPYIAIPGMAIVNIDNSMHAIAIYMAYRYSSTYIILGGAGILFYYFLFYYFCFFVSVNRSIAISQWRCRYYILISIFNTCIAIFSMVEMIRSCCCPLFLYGVLLYFQKFILQKPKGM